MTTSRLVAKGDMTTTKGRVMGGSSTWYADNGQALALYHDLATCGNCKGLFPILGSARDWMENGKPMVKHRTGYCVRAEKTSYLPAVLPPFCTRAAPTLRRQAMPHSRRRQARQPVMNRFMPSPAWRSISTPTSSKRQTGELSWAASPKVATFHALRPALRRTITSTGATKPWPENKELNNAEQQNHCQDEFHTGFH